MIFAAIIVPLIIIAVAYMLVAQFAPFFIEYLKRQKMGQTIREDGPQTHLEKAGTPTMGGLLIFSSVAIVTIILLITFMVARSDNNVIFAVILLVFTLLTAGIGIIDDLKKIRKGRSLGLNSKQKLALQFLLAFIFVIVVYFFAINVFNGSIMLMVPFLGDVFFSNYSMAEYSWLIAFGVILIIYLMAYTNAVNLTDGLDGLCGGVTVIVSITLAIIAVFEGNFPIAIFLLALTGATLGFLKFNRHPAKLFMGDTGSLAIGGALAGASILLGAEIFFIISGIVYFIEAFSVVLQVCYFKATKGKRIFRMSPYHHHLEQGGWKETKIVKAAIILTVITSMIALALYFCTVITQRIVIF